MRFDGDLRTCCVLVDCRSNLLRSNILTDCGSTLQFALVRQFQSLDSWETVRALSLCVSLQLVQYPLYPRMSY